MKKQTMRRWFAALLAAILCLTGLTFPVSVQAEEGEAPAEEVFAEEAFAEETPAEETLTEETITGEPVTTLLSAGTLSRETNFNGDWKFYLGTASNAQNVSFDDSGWKSVTLPHDFSISQSFTVSGEAESGFLPGGTGWYRKSFTMPESCEGKRVILSFDGAYKDTTVYVNGTQAGENHYGYTAFAFDITDYLICDGSTENVVAVKVVNDLPSSRWYSGSGIYRDVTLLVTDSVHVALNGTYVTTPDISDGVGTVQVTADVVNDGSEAAAVTVKNTVFTKSGTAASGAAQASAEVPAGETVSVTTAPVVEAPALWSVDSPNLYFVHTEIYVDGALKDSYDTDFGFRWFTFDSDNGFYLNGQALKLNGVCLHHDQGALGSAAYYDAIYRQLSVMKDMGVNAVRTSHNPADEDFIDICNELGLLVMEEAFDGWSVAKNGNSNDFSVYFNAALGEGNTVLGGSSTMTWAEFAVKSMVARDRNDPSVILWSLGNEIQEGAYAASSFPAIAQNLIDWISELDTTRPTTIGDNTRSANTGSVLGQVLNVIKNNGGVVGFNYASSSELSSLHGVYGAMLASETSSAVNSRGQYSSQANASAVDGSYHLTSYDTSTVSWGKFAYASLWDTLTADYVAGEFVWTGFDYIGEPTPWNGTGSGSVTRAGAIPNSSYFGIVDTAGFEKDTYYLYRSQWNHNDTTLHLVTAWDSDNMLTVSEKTPVVIYTNAPKVELYRNGELIGTAQRTVHTTGAGHQYFTYETASNNASACTAIAGSAGTSLYAAFQVAYEEGAISAKAYDENGNEITSTVGSKEVKTPGEADRLKVTQSKTSVAADGSSLVYIEVEVQDEKGVTDTTAQNAIYFSLSGNGEIVGVDNGDQATTEKYQQASVLTGTTSAHINAFAGKALVIVRSAKDPGGFSVEVTSQGLTGAGVSVDTYSVSEGTVTEGLVSYTMVRDYTVKAGTIPALQTAASGTMADGSTVTGTIVWEEIPETVYAAAGDHTIRGTLYFEGEEAIGVIVRLHVIADLIAVRNVSAVTTPLTVPDLPDVAVGIMADGALSGEFAVSWSEMTEEQFAEAGTVVLVEGTAQIMGTVTLPVTASVRVAEAVNTESVNVAPDAAEVTQDIPETNQSDSLESVNNGITKPGDNTAERWSNWNNRTNSDTAVLTFRWDTAQLLSSVNLYYYYDSCAARPESVSFEYSLNGTDFEAIESNEQLAEEYSLGAEYTYTFAYTVNPVAIRIILTQQNGTTGSNCVALTEAEIMTFAGKLEVNSSAALSEISVDGIALEGFLEDTLEYSASGEQVSAQSAVNAGITILPVLDHVVRILTVSEDGSDARTYVVTIDGEAACEHAVTERRGAVEPGCTTEGYTGDLYCTVCGALLETGEVIPATGHNTILKNAVAATCGTPGYTGDEVCIVCGETVKTGSVIPATGNHTYDGGTVTKEATETEEGIRTYTCTVCGETKTEVIPRLEPSVSKTEPAVTFSAAASSDGKIILTGQFEDFENSGDYYEVTGHGFVYYSSSKLGTKNLTVNTAGRTRVNVKSYKEDGSYSYSFTPAYASTYYTVRAFLVYEDANGITKYAYSNAVRVSYNNLK